MTARTDFNRRVFLASTAGLLTCPESEVLAKHSEREAVALSREHHRAVNLPRPIVVQYDAWSQLGIDFQQWLDYRFDYIDEPGSQIDFVFSVSWPRITCSTASKSTSLATYPIFRQSDNGNCAIRSRSLSVWCD